MTDTLRTEAVDGIEQIELIRGTQPVQGICLERFQHHCDFCDDVKEDERRQEGNKVIGETVGVLAVEMRPSSQGRLCLRSSIAVRKTVGEYFD